jgi:hypothetical protein
MRKVALNQIIYKFMKFTKKKIGASVKKSLPEEGK